MLKILDRYLWTATLQGLLIAWLALVLLDVFFAFISESGKTNALYSSAQAAIYLVYTLPGRFYEFFPTATLIGTLLGLGNLAANSEFTAMRAAGVSIIQIVSSIIKLGFILVVCIFLMGEYLIPVADLQARNFKAHLKNKNIVLVGGAGLWVKEKNDIIHIGKVITRDRLTDISIYSFNKGHTGLKSLTTSTDAISAKKGWNLKNVETKTFLPRSISISKKADTYRAGFLNSQILDVATVNPTQLTRKALTNIIDHQKRNKLKSDKYELIYWKRYSIPLSALVMLILAMPFLFGSTRGGGAGQRVFIGIVVGVVFFLANQAINGLGNVYGVAPILSAFLPSLIFLIVGMFALTRIR